MLHDTYTKSKHCEVSICFDMDEENECFTYMLGVGVDKADADVKQRAGTYCHQMQGGLYVIFTTPPYEDDGYVQAIQELWENILESWLPESKYAYDSTRNDFEYYDERDHSWLHNGKSQMDTYIPICER